MKYGTKMTQKVKLRKKTERLVSFKRKRSSSSFKGVLFVKRQGKWRAQFCYDKRKVYLGSFQTEIEAAIARDKALRKLFPEKKQLFNFPELQSAASQSEVRDISNRIMQSQQEKPHIEHDIPKDFDFSIDSFDFSHINFTQWSSIGSTPYLG